MIMGPFTYEFMQ